MEGLYERIYKVVCQIPGGRVATYGQVASIVGWALAALKYNQDRPVPWQRVINTQGKVSTGYYQRELLEKEGIIFDAQGRTDLERFGWDGSDNTCFW